jgi:hypothetical protein
MVSSIPAWNWWEVRASDFTILQEGTGTQPYTCSASPVGTGNYVTAQTDPSDGTKLWFLQEYANSATTCIWQTRWIQVTLAGPLSKVGGKAKIGGQSRI